VVKKLHSAEVLQEFKFASLRSLRLCVRQASQIRKLIRTKS
jgi:hypothetical protein